MSPTPDISTYKRCGCREGGQRTGRRLGAACEKLHRGDGAWNQHHGSWFAKAELPPGPDGRRQAPLQYGGFATRDEARDWMDAALRLVAIPEEGTAGHAGRAEILDLIRQSRKAGAALPGYEDLRRRHLYGAAYQPGTTGQFLLTWLDGREAAEAIKATTVKSYGQHIRTLWLPQLGEIPLDKLQARHVMAAFAAIDANNAAILEAKASPDPEVRKSVAGQRPCGPATKNRYRATLRKALTDAARAHLITFNPAGRESIELPGSKPRLTEWTVRREAVWRAGYDERVASLPPVSHMKGARFRCWQDAVYRPSLSMVWRIDHMTAFLDKTEGTWLYPLWYLMMYRGLRRGEACGIRWADVDLAAGEIQVAVNRVQVGWDVFETDPKSEASQAPVTLDQAAVGVLTDWQLRQRDEASKWGDAWTDTGHVFTKESGQAYHPSYVSSRFEHAAFELGLPPCRLHDLRHATASLARHAGADLKAIQALLRHANYTITADMYTAIFQEAEREMAEDMSRVVPTRAAKAAAARKDQH